MIYRKYLIAFVAAPAINGDNRGLLTGYHVRKQRTKIKVTLLKGKFHFNRPNWHYGRLTHLLRVLVRIGKAGHGLDQRQSLATFFGQFVLHPGRHFAKIVSRHQLAVLQ